MNYVNFNEAIGVACVALLIDSVWLLVSVVHISTIFVLQ